MIELKQVSFTYQGQEHDGLRDIDLTIADGECVLLCGRSGCGKTTIGLIPQFYQGELQGRVLVDGQEISSLPMYQIAAKVGSVFQNPRTQFFNVDTDSEIAFGIENEARPPRELAERVEQTTEDLRTARSPSASRMRPGRPGNWRSAWSRRRRICASRAFAAAISSSCPAGKSRRSHSHPSTP